MKILFLTNIPSPYRMDFFNELGESCDLTVLFERHKADDRDREWLLNQANSFHAEYLRGFKIGADNAFCPEVVKWLVKSFDIIVIGGYSTPTAMFVIFLLRMMRKPFVLNADGGLIKKDSRARHLLKSYFIQSAQYYLSSGKKTNQYLKHYGAKPDAIFEYPFSSFRKQDIKEYNWQEKLSCRDELKISERQIILAVGQFIYRKGFDTLLEACSLLPKDYGVYIVGGKPTSNYSALQKEYKLDNVHFIEFKDKDTLNKYYMACDLFVLPTREDIWGLVINEAMAYGLPVITTTKCVAGLELIENDKNGFVIPPDNAMMLAEKIQAILDNTDLAADMRTNSLGKIQKYTLEEMVKQHLNVFQQILHVQGN